RWVYLDIGKFGGLAETMDESIRYPIRTPRDGDELAPCVLAGPTCDSADVMYEREPYALPISLEIGDKGLIEGTGAYTATYSSVAFHWLAPLKTYHIWRADGGLKWLPSVRNGRPRLQRVMRCSTSPMGRPDSRKRRSACAKGVEPNWRWLPPRAAASSVRCGSGRYRPVLTGGGCCSAPSRARPAPPGAGTAPRTCSPRRGEAPNHPP